MVQHPAPWSRPAPGPLLDHLDPTWSTLCNHTPEIADQGGSRWNRGTIGIMVLGVGPEALWSHFYILLIEDEKEWEVESILDYRERYGRGQFLVKWKGYPNSENSWEPVEGLESGQDLV